MAKVRVYELAKEFNIESKVLVEKLNATGMIVKNYMSTLDEDTIVKARDIILGISSNGDNAGVASVSEVVEEKRIKPRVIRRRKKTVEAEPEQPEVISKEGGEGTLPAETIPDKKTISDKTEDIVFEEKKMVKDDQVVLQQEEAKEKDEGVILETPETVPAKAKDITKAKKSKKRLKDKPAKIIKMAEEATLKKLLEQESQEKTKGKQKKSRVSAKKVIDKSVLSDKKTRTQKVLPDTDTVATEKVTRKKKDKKKALKKDEKVIESVRHRHRKVEVFERADLYEGRKPRPKDKKGGKKGKDAGRKKQQTSITIPKAIKRRLKVQPEMTVAELAKAMGIKGVELVKKLMSMGIMGNVNQIIDFETASILADDFGYEIELDQFEAETFIEEIEDSVKDLKPRPPVVTIMGHVDHGKTSLLDYIRQSNIIGGESGGITQHIGAYYVNTKGGDIVFLDTPGHEAFTAMRARGAKVTDIIVLVVAADDGVMPQTKEAINHARAAEIPIIVAINKMDKSDADPDKVTRELAELGLAPEEWSGDTIFGKISAKTGEGISELMELILLQSEMLELKANPDKPARGTIIEAHLNKSKGSVATVLIKNGTLKQSNYFVCGECYGRIRAMLNNRGKKMLVAGPSMPAEIYGISGVPMAGDEFVVVRDERTAKQIADHRVGQARKDVTSSGVVSLDDLYEKIKDGAIKELNIVLKADVQGSLEALTESLLKLSTDEVKLKVIHSATGAITETDVMLAMSSNAIIIGFNVRAHPRVVQVAEKKHIDIRYYEVIYNVLEDIKLAMAGLLEPILNEKVIGRADIKEIFNVPKIGTVAGCQVTHGFIDRNAKVRLLRDEVVVYDGSMVSLKRFKDDVKEVQSGYECGIALKDFKDVKPGDVFEVYQIEEIKAEL
jgi:translation initiation factor IF-2